MIARAAAPQPRQLTPRALPRPGLLTPLARAAESEQPGLRYASGKRRLVETQVHPIRLVMILPKLLRMFF